MQKINPEQEKKKIISFIQKTLKEQGFNKLVLGLSGGIDSSTSAFLSAGAIGPENLYILLLPYKNQDMSLAKQLIKNLKILQKNVVEIDISKAFDMFKTGGTRGGPPSTARIRQPAERTSDGGSAGQDPSQIRKGNILARLRMIYLFDSAKRLSALVCGTENRSEHLLGYYTRFGDEASDIEPIIHLYKTQVQKLAEYLKIPKDIIDQPPTAGLWPGQTDEKELGFTYKEADTILHLFFVKKKSPKEIEKKIPGKIVKKVLQRVKENLFKHQTPYSL